METQRRLLEVQSAADEVRAIFARAGLLPASLPAIVKDGHEAPIIDSARSAESADSGKLGARSMPFPSSISSVSRRTSIMNISMPSAPTTARSRRPPAAAAVQAAPAAVKQPQTNVRTDKKAPAVPQLKARPSAVGPANGPARKPTSSLGDRSRLSSSALGKPSSPRLKSPAPAAPTPASASATGAALNLASAEPDRSFSTSANVSGSSAHAPPIHVHINFPPEATAAIAATARHHPAAPAAAVNSSAVVTARRRKAPPPQLLAIPIVAVPPPAQQPSASTYRSLPHANAVSVALPIPVTVKHPSVVPAASSPTSVVSQQASVIGASASAGVKSPLSVSGRTDAAVIVASKGGAQPARSAAISTSAAAEPPNGGLSALVATMWSDVMGLLRDSHQQKHDVINHGPPQPAFPAAAIASSPSVATQPSTFSPRMLRVDSATSPMMHHLQQNQPKTQHQTHAPTSPQSAGARMRPSVFTSGGSNGGGGLQPVRVVPVVSPSSSSSRSDGTPTPGVSGGAGGSWSAPQASPLGGGASAAASAAPSTLTSPTGLVSPQSAFASSADIAPQQQPQQPSLLPPPQAAPTVVELGGRSFQLLQDALSQLRSELTAHSSNITGALNSTRAEISEKLDGAVANLSSSISNASFAAASTNAVNASMAAPIQRPSTSAAPSDVNATLLSSAESIQEAAENGAAVAVATEVLPALALLAEEIRSVRETVTTTILSNRQAVNTTVVGQPPPPQQPPRSTAAEDAAFEAVETHLSSLAVEGRLSSLAEGINNLTSHVNALTSQLDNRHRRHYAGSVQREDESVAAEGTPLPSPLSEQEVSSGAGTGTTSSITGSIALSGRDIPPPEGPPPQAVREGVISSSPLSVGEVRLPSQHLTLSSLAVGRGSIRVEPIAFRTATSAGNSSSSAPPLSPGEIPAWVLQNLPPPSAANASTAIAGGGVYGYAITLPAEALSSSTTIPVSTIGGNANGLPLSLRAALAAVRRRRPQVTPKWGDGSRPATAGSTASAFDAQASSHDSAASEEDSGAFSASLGGTGTSGTVISPASESSRAQAAAPAGQQQTHAKFVAHSSFSRAKSAGGDSGAGAGLKGHRGSSGSRLPVLKGRQRGDGSVAGSSYSVSPRPATASSAASNSFSGSGRGSEGNMAASVSASGRPQSAPEASSARRIGRSSSANRHSTSTRASASKSRRAARSNAAVAGAAVPASQRPSTAASASRSAAAAAAVGGAGNSALSPGEVRLARERSAAWAKTLRR